MKFGVILAGCGVYDGAEIHEAVLTLLYLNQQGVEVEIFAPDIPQREVVNHLNGEQLLEERNVLQESARIARGKIANLKDADFNSLDALFLPGGFGVAKNFSDLLQKGSDAEVNEEIKNALSSMIKQNKPIGAVCITPAILAAALRECGVTVTIGEDEGTAGAIEEMGATHINCPVTDIVIDEKNKIVTAPAYMYDASISNVAKGIEKAVNEVIKLSN